MRGQADGGGAGEDAAVLSLDYFRQSQLGVDATVRIDIFNKVI